jgi:regulator of sigma E protease
MSFLTFGLGAVIAIVVLVVVHEFGHFLVAKLFRVGVPVFSVGMGPRVFGVRWRGTDYRLSAFPIGGYVRMAGADPFGEEDASGGRVDPDTDFMRKPVWQRLLIMLAGPGANIVLPVLLFTTLFLLGYPEFPAVFGTVAHDSPAWQAGLREGDRVVAVDGEPVKVYRQLERRLVALADQPTTLTVERGSETVQVVLPPEATPLVGPATLDELGFGAMRGFLSTRVGVSEPDSPAGRAGIGTFDAIMEVDGAEVGSWDAMMAALTPGTAHRVRVRSRRPGDEEATERSLSLEPVPGWSARPGDPWTNPWGLVPSDVFVGGLRDGRPATRAGVREGDRLWKVDGEVVHDFVHLMGLVRAAAGDDLEDPRAIPVTLIREGEPIALSITPTLVSEPTPYGTRTRPILGIEPVPQARVLPDRVYVQYGPVQSVGLGLAQTWDAASTIFAGFDSLIRGNNDPRDMVGGPVAIFTITGQSLSMGFYAYSNTIAIISISLAIVNLLPVPALDGGQIVVFLIEWVRGRPLSAEIRMRIQMAGVVVLFALIVLVTVNDVGRLIFPPG